MSLEITAMLTKVIFANEQNSFVVAEFVDCHSAKRFRASSENLRVGKSDGQQRYKIFGEWRTNPKYGETFHIAYAEPLKPQTLAGLVPFLANNVKGVGEKTAERLVNSLDLSSMDDLLLICRENPERIKHFFGRRDEIAADVIAAIVGDEHYRQIMMFLHDNNIPSRFAKKIYERYGSAALEILKENPYRLIRDFRNVGFKRADAIAQKLGVPARSRFRLEAGFVYVLEKALDEGHCCLTREQLLKRGLDVLAGNEPMTSEWLLGELREIFRQQKDSSDVSFCIRTPSPVGPGEGSIGEVLFYLPDVFDMENRIAHYCKERLAVTGLGVSGPVAELRARPASLKEVPGVPWDSLSDEQLVAVQASVEDNFMILTGGPGCGKTFVLKAIYRVQQHLKRTVALCAPTGLAAKRMSLSVGAKATTLHKLLGLGRVSESGSSEPSLSSDSQGIPLDLADTVICDESSMLSIDLLLALLEAMGSNKTLILVGDVDQLPSVGPGQCLRDLMMSEQVRVCRLSKIFRQAGSSPIPLAARQIISGVKPEFDHRAFTHALQDRRDFAFLGAKVEEFYERLFPFLQETVPQVYDLDPIKDVQILVPMRKSAVGQDEINRRMQEVFNPARSDRNEVSCRSGSFILREGDKVIYTRNNYNKDVCNGDMGFVKVIVSSREKTEIDVTFGDRTVRLEDEEADDLQLCYAMTIHKSQGSEFPLCIVPLYSAYYSMLYRNLLYTAVTRASRSVVIIGEEWALTRAVRNAEVARRMTALESLLRMPGKVTTLTQ